MRKAYAAGGMIVRTATRGGNSGGSSSNSKGGNSSKQADEPSNSPGPANAGGGSSSAANKSPAPETSPVVVTKADPALLAAIKNGRIRGRNHQGNPQQQQQRHHHHNQPPPDVMNLTAKNYRLAKELSELRVRHREECKKQTRLSMENMKLSSKYRDAMNQVALLKKEVAYYQQRSETLAKNGIRALPSPESPVDTPPSLSPSTTTTPAAPTVSATPAPSASPPSASPTMTTPRKPVVLADVVAEINRMDRILADHAARADGKPLDHDTTVQTPDLAFLKSATTESLTPSSTSSEEQGTPEGTASPTSSASDNVDEATDEFDNEIEGLSSPALSNDLVDSDKESKEEWEPRRVRSKTPDHQIYFPHTASPKFRFNEEYPGDITASVRTGKSQRLSIERLDEFKEDEEPAPSLKQPQLPSSDVVRRASTSSSLSSIDAFEASFNTDFPDSFSPRDDSPERPQREEIYNPFSYSPATYDWSRPSNSNLTTYVSPSDPPGRDRTSPQRKKPPMRKSPTSSDPSNGLLPRFHRMAKKDQASTQAATATSSSSFASASTSSRTPLAGSGAFLLHTPPPPSPLTSNESPPISTGSPSASPTAPSERAVSTPPAAVNYVPSPAMLSGMNLSSQDEPKRPEKTGFEAARARREKVLQPRIAVTDSSTTHPRASPPPPPPPSSSPSASSSPDEKRLVKGLDPRSREAILMSARERLSSSSVSSSALAAAKAAMSTSPSPPPKSSSTTLSLYATPPQRDMIGEAATGSASPAAAAGVAENHHPNHHPSHSSSAAAVLWGGNVGRPGGSFDENDGDIPLRSSLTARNADTKAAMPLPPPPPVASPSSASDRHPHLSSASSSASSRRFGPKPRHIWSDANPGSDPTISEAGPVPEKTSALVAARTGGADNAAPPFVQ